MNSIATHLAEKIASAKVIADPFSHIELEESFPPEILSELQAMMPPRESFIKGKHLDSVINGKPTRFTITLGDQRKHINRLEEPFRSFWAEVGHHLQNDQIGRAAFKQLGETLESKRQLDLNSISYKPRPILVRDFGGYKILPHRDTYSKLITCQLYIPADNSRAECGTQFLEPLAGIRKPNQPEHFNVVKKMKFSPNHGYLFPVHSQSWHSVETIEAGIPRDSIMILFEREKN